MRGMARMLADGKEKEDGGWRMDEAEGLMRVGLGHSRSGDGMAIRVVWR